MSSTLVAETYEYTITGLKAGVEYFVRVRAENERGTSLPRLSNPLSEIPRRAPDEIVYGGVKISSIPAGIAPVKRACSCLTFHGKARSTIMAAT